MSTVKVNELSTYSGTDISIETGKTVSGTASQFKMTDVVQGDVLYGSAADTLSRLAPGTSGQFLQTTGAGADPVWATVAGGLTTASQWRVTANFTGDAAPIASNLEEVDLPVGFGILGSSMTESSGIFTFPSTGYWLIRFHALFQAGVALGSLYNIPEIRTTTNNSTYAEACVSSAALHAANERGGATAEYIFDVTDTTQCKCRFDVNVEHTDCIIKGDSAKNETFMTFMKLGDT